MKKDQFLFLNILGQIDDTFIEISSQPWRKEKTTIWKIKAEEIRDITFCI